MRELAAAAVLLAAGYALGRWRPARRASDWANWKKYRPVLNGVRWPRGNGASGPTPSNGQTTVHPRLGRPLLAGCACARTTDGPPVEHLAEPKQLGGVGPGEPGGDNRPSARRHGPVWWAVWLVLSAENIAWLITHPIQGSRAWRHRHDALPPRSAPLRFRSITDQENR